MFDVCSIKVLQKYKKVQKLQKIWPEICKIWPFRADFVPLQRLLIEKGMKLRLLIVLACIAIFAGAIVMSSCNVTRKVTTESSFFQRGDTTIQIVTKTTETYDATKK